MGAVSEWGGGEGLLLYNVPNRTAVTADSASVAVLTAFLTLYLAFLIIFPGIRKERFTTFATVTLSIFVGNAIMVCRFGSSWHVASTHIVSAYRAFSKELVPASIGAYIGLTHVNITLLGDNNSLIDYNERFIWEGSSEMNDGYRAALKRGLPFPILTVAEYFSLGQEGFTWGGNYRAAGYYTSILLWAAFASWLVMNVLLVVVPRYGAFAMAQTGLLMLFSALAYHCLLPHAPLCVRFEHTTLSFSFGWCFWLNIITGAVSTLVGLLILTIDIIYPNRFTTVLEVDYDTPYDRHIIIEDSHHKRKSGKHLEEPPGLGRRILRRLSSKKDECGTTSGSSSGGGRSNAGFEMDPTSAPKSPWAYPDRADGPPNSPWNYPLHRVSPQDFRRQDSASSHGSSVPPTPSSLPSPHHSFRQPTNSAKLGKEVPLW